jgi:hypothetical protein
LKWRSDDKAWIVVGNLGWQGDTPLSGVVLIWAVTRMPDSSAWIFVFIVVVLLLWFLRWFLPAFNRRLKELAEEQDRRQKERMMAQARQIAAEMGLDPRYLEVFVEDWCRVKHGGEPVVSIEVKDKKEES